MNRVQHPSNNAVLGAPVGWKQGELPCGALPITRTEVNGVPAIACWFQPTERERLAIADGAPIALWVIGNTMPPVALEVD